MWKILKQLWNDESGADALEYALIAGLIAIILIAALSGDFREKFVGLFTALGDKFQEATDDLQTSSETGE